MAKEKWEEIYKKFEMNLPWCIEEVPSWFKKLIISKWVKPCKTLDVGCGVGNYANFLAKKEFEVTAIDISKKVIDMAVKKNAVKNLRFKAHDAFKLKSLGKFDFVYEISILHNIEPNKRKKYIDNLYSVLNKNGKLLVCCFSKGDWLFRGKDKLYSADLDNTIYPLAKEDFEKLFGDRFVIEKIKKVYMGRKGKRKRERFVCLMRKR